MGLLVGEAVYRRNIIVISMPRTAISSPKTMLNRKFMSERKSLMRVVRSVCSSLLFVWSLFEGMC